MHQGMNRLHHFRQLGGPAFLNIIPWINNDTPYSAGWLDLRAEPFVLSLPRFPAHRFQDVQLIDLFTHNFAFFGTRVNGNEATNILIAGPDWQGEPPAGVEHVARAETRLVKIVTRILLEHPGDGRRDPCARRPVPARAPEPLHRRACAAGLRRRSSFPCPPRRSSKRGRPSSSAT